MQVYNEETGEWEDQPDYEGGGDDSLAIDSIDWSATGYDDGQDDSAGIDGLLDTEETFTDEYGWKWTHNANGTWTGESPDGEIATYDADGNEVGADTEEDTSEWVDGLSRNDDGTWTYIDDKGRALRFDNNGTWLNEAAFTGNADTKLDTGTVTGDKSSDTDSKVDDSSKTFTPETKVILGQTFTKQADGSWQDADGFKYSQQDMDEADAGRHDAQWEGFTFGIGDDGRGVYTQTDRNGITRTYDAETGQQLSAYDLDGLSVTGTDNDVKIVRNPDGSLTTTHPDGLITTTMPDGTKITQNGPGGSTQTTDKNGNTTQTTPSGTNPNGTLADTLKNTTVTGGTGNDTVKDNSKTTPATKNNTAGLAALAALLLANKGGSQTPGYNGTNDPGLINMGMTFNREIDPATGQVKSQGFAGMAAGGYMDDTIAAVNSATTDADARYLRGETDGMADEIPAVIEGGQPAALAHGEFVIPADVVSHLGNGNSDAGAKKLYGMMDKIRLARTGSKEQGRQIDPDKFLPGGEVKGIPALAKGGRVKRFNTGGTTSTTAAQSELSPWAGAYTTGMLGQANAIGNAMMSTKGPNQFVYQGNRVQGLSDTEKGAITAAGALGTPSNLATYAQNIADAAKDAGNATLNATTFGSQYTAPVAYTATTFDNTYSGTGAYDPTKFDNQYKGTDPYTAAKFDNLYKGTDPYQAAKFENQYQKAAPYTAATFAGDEFTGAQVAKYMNPYLQQSLDPQIKAAQDAATRQRLADAGRLTAAGAFGGGRQAVMESEGNRNLLDTIAAITGKGYDTAYNTARDQFNVSQAQGLDRQKASEASRQFGATFGQADSRNFAELGLRAKEAEEASRQYGNTAAMTNASNLANFGMRAKEAEEASRQYGNTAAMTNASNMANFAQQAAAAAEQSKQFGKSSAITEASNLANFGMRAKEASEQSKQFGKTTEMTNADRAANYGARAAEASEQSKQNAAKFGLDALRDSITGYKAAGDLGLAGNIDARANINTQLTAGATERGNEQAKLDANKAKFDEGTKAIFDGLKLKKDMLSGLPIGTTTPISPNTATSEQIAALASMLGITDDEVKSMFGIK